MAEWGAEAKGRFLEGFMCHMSHMSQKLSPEMGEEAEALSNLASFAWHLHEALKFVGQWNMDFVDLQSIFAYLAQRMWVVF